MTDTTTDQPPRLDDSGSRATRAGDSIFSGLASAAGLTILLALAGVALFLVIEGAPAFTASGESAYGKDNIVVYVWPLLYGTLLAAVLAMVIVTPLAVGLALVISHYAPRRVGTYLGYLIDLLAAVPSVVYGLWGRVVLAPALLPLYLWLSDNLGWIPFFDGGESGPTHGRTISTAGIVLAVMALPIVTAICREVFIQTPRIHEEAALALGATKWEMIRMTVFPYARSGVISAVLLGLGRALGETMAVAMVLSGAGIITIDLIGTQNPSTIAANIALNFGNASGSKINTLIFSGLVLFVVSFAVNFVGRWIASRGEVKG